jgi:hypothetical protein
MAAAIMGCGDEDDEASAGSAGGGGTSSSLSQAEFASRANAICSRRRQELGKDLQAYALAFRKRHPNQRAAADAFPGGLRSVGIPGLQAVANELRQLGLPSDDDGQAEAYLDEFEAAIDSARGRAQTDEDQYVGDFERSWELAREYGLGACAFGG